MRIGIVQFPGSNCERETMLAIKRAGMEPVEYLWNEPREKLRDLDGYVIVGGFSYEDRSRAGIIAALDPVMLELKEQSDKGKPILGICNGAQILVETGLVPGLENNKSGMALTENKRIANDKILGSGFYNAWVHMRLTDNYQRNAFTQRLTSKDILFVPVAHAEGRFVMTDALLQEIEMQGLNVFQYCDEAGFVHDNFPINPNGSMKNIAAIANKAGNVMAMMPHPERTAAGDAIFFSMRDYIHKGHVEKVAPLYYYPRRPQIKPYQKPEMAHESIVELMITDNHALTVQKTLQQLGHHVKVKRQIHWEIHCDSEELIQQMKTSSVLFNPRKETEVFQKKSVNPYQAIYLVRAKDDLHGQATRQNLQDHFGIYAHAVHHSVLWQFESETDIKHLIQTILSTNIIFNTYAHDCYDYPYITY